MTADRGDAVRFHLCSSKYLADHRGVGDRNLLVQRTDIFEPDMPTRIDKIMQPPLQLFRVVFGQLMQQFAILPGEFH